VSEGCRNGPSMAKEVTPMKCRVPLSTLTAVTALAVLTATAWPDSGSPGASPAAPVRLRFHNGSVVQPAVLLDAVEMETRLGKLSIPAHEVRRIDFGFRLSEE